MHPASSASPRLRIWLALGITCAVAAVAAVARLRDGAAPATPAPAETPAMPAVTDEPTVEPVEVAEQAAPIAIVVVTSRTKIARGEPLPLAFYAVNRTARSLSVLRSLDASDVGWRYPKIDIEIRDQAGREVEGPMMGRCGLVNPLAAADFVELASGERADLFGEGAFGHYKLHDTSHLARGRYTVTLHYDLRFTDAERGGSVDKTVQAKIASLPRGVYSSPPVTIDVE